jgi:ubiquinone/menaquinone biosynthesis C-methylase UbiE
MMIAAAIRELMAKNLTASTGLAALTASLDARVNNHALDPILAERIEDLLVALGFPKKAIDDIKVANPNDLRPLLGEIRHQLGFDAKLLHTETRVAAWSYKDTTLLQDIGDFARLHGDAITRGIIPALEGMSDRFAAGATFLDIGVGVAGTAIQLAENLPKTKIVGIDPYLPSLNLARANVAKANLEDRISLREQGAESLEDDQVFDLAWMPIPFMKESVVPRAVERTFRALRPGGWMVLAFMDCESGDDATRAARRLRLAMWGSGLWTMERMQELLKANGLKSVRDIPSPPGSPARFAVGQRQ